MELPIYTSPQRKKNEQRQRHKERAYGTNCDTPTTQQMETQW